MRATDERDDADARERAKGLMDAGVLANRTRARETTARADAD